VLAIAKRSEIVHRRGEVVLIAPIHVTLNIQHGTVCINRPTYRSRRSVVSEYPGKIRSGNILKPCLGRRVCEARVVCANHVGLAAVASHELVAKVRQIVRTCWCACVKVRVHASRRWIEDRRRPIAEVALPLLSGRNGIFRRTGRTTEAKPFVIDEEVAFLAS
jgi:hypothetical protein